MAIILGIDPGSRITGFGVINTLAGNKMEYITSGCIRTGKGELPERLQCIFESITQLIEQYCPQEFAIEQVFMGKCRLSIKARSGARRLYCCRAIAELTHS